MTEGLPDPLEEGVSSADRSNQLSVPTPEERKASSPGSAKPAGTAEPRKPTPTQRPRSPSRPSPFAGLLAEAGAVHRPSSPAPAPPVVKPPPARTLGAYHVLGELGQGGMAIVYKALQPSLDRLVALKELRPEYASDPQVMARFEREATSLAALQHGNIVHIHDFIREVDTAYIVMEYVEGIDLFDLLAECRRLPPDVAAAVALQLAEGLEYAHYHGIIHRDVKPSNLLISKLGEVKIMDFGIARDHTRAEITQIGMSLGTPAYMAPEQIRGDKVDFRADIFGIGIVLYEMLAGRKPWGEDDAPTNVARRVLYEEMTPIRQHCPDLPSALARILEACLQKEQDRRYASTHELRRSLADFLSQALTIDPRQRLVVFLRNRGRITDGEATSFVHPSILYDGVLRRRDLGLPAVEPSSLLRPVIRIGAAALAASVLAALLGLWSPVPGLATLPEQRPVLRLDKRKVDGPRKQKPPKGQSPSRAPVGPRT